MTCDNESMREIQQQHHKWHDHNFPTSTAEDMLIGVVEEVGELAHANLKSRQVGENLEADERDAIGDIIIFLIGYCNKRNFSVMDIIRQTWDEVKQRDYVAMREKVAEEK